VVMTLPVLKPLKELFPAAHTAVLTSRGAATVLKNNPFVDEVIAFDPIWFYPSSRDPYRAFISRLRSRTFDLVIEARADIRDILLLAWPLRTRHLLSYDVGGGGYLLTDTVPYPGLKHKVEYHLDLVRHLGYDGKGLEWGVYLTAEEQQRVDAIMAERGITRPFIAVHPGSRLQLKRWPARQYGQVCDLLAERQGLLVAVFGAAEERTIVEEMTAGMRKQPVLLVGDIGLREMAGILARAELFICNDSAPMHIAAAMRTPTVAIFGPSKSIETGPYGSGHSVVEKDFPCRYRCDESTCIHDRHNACMDDITVDDVYHAAAAILARSGKAHVQT